MKHILLCVSLAFTLHAFDELSQAILDSKMATLQVCLDANSSRIDEAIGFAIMNDKLDVIKWIDDHYKVSYQQNKFLKYATFKCNEPIVSYLMQRQDPNMLFQQFKQRPLERAAIFCDNNTVKILLDAGAQLELENPVKRTPLFAAVKNNLLHSASILITYGARVNKTDVYGYTPLDYAIENNNPEMITLLKQNGAQTRHFIYDEKQMLNMIASQDDKTLEKDLDTLSKKLYNGDNLLSHAIKTDDLWLFKFLLQQNTPLDALNDDGTLPIQHAISLCRTQMVSALIKDKASLNFYPDHRAINAIIPESCNTELAYLVNKQQEEASDTFRDPDTGLIWEDTLPKKKFILKKAKLYCESLKLEGLHWRLPSADEFNTIIDLSRPFGYRKKRGFKLYQDTSGYWVTSPTNKAYYMFFSTDKNTLGTPGMPYDGLNQVHCVSENHATTH